ncbi:MAG: FkbM family methyltransferase [Gillisia sp.]
MIRKIYNLIPAELQKWLKLKYYNFKIKEYSFSLENNIYCTTDHKSWKIFTHSPLYFIVKDVTRYEKYYDVAKGDIVIDAGANEGILTLIYSQKVSSSGKVFAFEPDKINLLAFKENLNLNENTSNISLEKKGLWEKSSIIEFYETGTVGSSVFYQDEKSVKKNISVLSIDDFVDSENINKLDFIKMDIEGAEIETLKGARNTIKSLKPNFAIASYHIIENEVTYKKVEEFFTEMNYPYKTIFFEDGEIITYAGPTMQEP